MEESKYPVTKVLPKKGATSVALNMHGPPQNLFLLTQEYLIMNLSQIHRRATGSDSPPLVFMAGDFQGLGEEHVYVTL
jgi:hypothetical protein